MNRIFLLSIFLLFVIVSGCKKDKPDINDSDPAKGKPKHCRIISSPGFNQNIIYNFTYNEDSSIKAINTKSGPYKYYYEDGRLKAIVEESIYGYIDSFDTDQSGKVTGRRVYGIYDDDEPYIVNLYSVIYLYNSQGKIIQAKYQIPRYSYGEIPHSIDHGAYYYSYDGKGNVVKEIDSIQYQNAPVKLRYSAFYNYDGMKNPYYLMPLYSLSQTSNLMMVSSNNITRKYETFENGKERITEFSYSYLQEGYPNEVKVYYPQTNDSSKYEYSYECK